MEAKHNANILLASDVHHPLPKSNSKHTGPWLCWSENEVRQVVVGALPPYPVDSDGPLSISVHTSFEAHWASLLLVVNPSHCRALSSLMFSERRLCQGCSCFEKPWHRPCVERPEENITQVCLDWVKPTAAESVQQRSRFSCWIKCFFIYS